MPVSFGIAYLGYLRLLYHNKNDRNNCQSFMEEEYRQGLNLVVGMLRSLENLPDFRADTFTLQRIARLADLPKYTVAVEEPSASESPPMEETVPQEVLLGDRRGGANGRTGRQRRRRSKNCVPRSWPVPNVLTLSPSGTLWFSELEIRAQS